MYKSNNKLNKIIKNKVLSKKIIAVLLMKKKFKKLLIEIKVHNTIILFKLVELVRTKLNSLK